MKDAGVQEIMEALETRTRKTELVAKLAEKYGKTERTVWNWVREAEEELLARHGYDPRKREAARKKLMASLSTRLTRYYRAWEEVEPTLEAVGKYAKIERLIHPLEGRVCEVLHLNRFLPDAGLADADVRAEVLDALRRNLGSIPRDELIELREALSREIQARNYGERKAGVEVEAEEEDENMEDLI